MEDTNSKRVKYLQKSMDEMSKEVAEFKLSNFDLEKQIEKQTKEMKK